MKGDTFLGILIACGTIWVFLLVGTLGGYNIKEACEDFGKVRILGTLYECSFKEVK